LDLIAGFASSGERKDKKLKPERLEEVQDRFEFFHDTSKSILKRVK
jgi:hypothetical protein